MENKFKSPIMVTKSFLPPIEEYNKQIEKIWKTNWLTNLGPLHEEFKEKLKNYLLLNNISLFVNGHQALEIAIKCLNLKKGGEIITTPFTFASTTHAITNTGFKPVFCDIEMDHYNMDANKIEKLITENTVAIMPVHVFGNPCDVEKIQEIADKYNLKVIYDAAHTFGVKIDEKGIGSFGDLSMFSLHATKVFNSIEGGVLSFRDPSLKRKILNLKNFGIEGPESVVDIAGNAKMNEFQAAMGLVNLRYVEEEIEKRKLLVENYKRELLKIEGIKVLEDIEGVRHNYAYFPILIDESKFGMTRDELHEKMKEYNVFTRKYFYPLITDFQCYKGKYKDDHLVNANYVGDRVMTLPLYGNLDLEDVLQICKIIRNEHQS